MPNFALRHRRLGSLALAAAAVFLILLTACGRPRLPDHPPILLLTIDTLRADHLSSYGYPRQTSPVLDALAAEGARFDFAISQWPKTGPSFASIMTSSYPKDNNIVRRVGIRVPCSYRMLAEELQAAGYDTRGVVANGALGREFCFDQGFDDYVESWKGAKSQHAIDAATVAGKVTDLALESLSRADEKKPLFLWVHYLDPHFPYTPPPEYAERFQGDGKVVTGEKVPIDLGSTRRFVGGIGVSQVLDDSDDLDRYVARYDGEIAYVDHEIGRLFDALRERGLWDRMLVVMTSDHGESLGEHGYYFGHGMYPFQDGLRVPLVVRFPRIVEPHVDPDPVELLDLAPTILEAAGVQLDKGRWAQGGSLFDRMWGQVSGKGRLVYSESGYAVHRKWMKSVSDGRFKLIWLPAIQEQRRCLGRASEYAFFDLHSDPGELTDVTDRHLAEMESFQRQLRTWFLAPRFELERDPETCTSQTTETAPETIEQLKALGYL